jgi:dihydrofolate reductase
MPRARAGVVVKGEEGHEKGHHGGVRVVGRRDASAGRAGRGSDGRLQVRRWVVPHTDEVFGQAVDQMFGQPFDLLLGRKTYEIFAAHWPYAEGGDYDAIAKLFNSTTKYVATRKAMDLTWAGSVALHDAAADIARLKREDGPALVTQGSSDLIQTLLANDLIDEINTFMFPIVLGNGKKLFDRGAKPAAFKLVDSRVTTTGVVIACYQRAGAVVTGDYAMDPPTPAEIARRERMKREG